MFNTNKLKRADQVIPLLTMSSIIKVHDEKVPADPVLLFQHMRVLQRHSKMKLKIFGIWAPYLLSLFDDIGMRNTQKSAISDCFQILYIDIDNTSATYIIDGEYLLRRIVWDARKHLTLL